MNEVEIENILSIVNRKDDRSIYCVSKIGLLCTRIF